jgi:hypothetical protein
MSDPPAAATTSRTGRLLGLVRALLDYGRQLVDKLQQRGPASNLTDLVYPFGTCDVAWILARITRGLQRAAALEAWLFTRPDRTPSTRTTPAASRPRAERPTQPATTQRPASPSSPDDFAAEVRCRPVGAVLADICRDLGILPCQKLWSDLLLAIIGNRGNLIALYRDIDTRLDVWLLHPRPVTLQGAMSATGPP